MLSIANALRLARRGKVLIRAQSVCGALPAHSRQLAATAADQSDALAADANSDEVLFDAAAASAPYSVHQLIGDPRTGIADDTTTAPWGDDINVEWVWSDPTRGVEWYRYSQAGPSVLPYMYMDSRLSDHSKNLMYMLRCKDPNRWTIPALADKFRIRRQRVMAILALKEMQAHNLEQGLNLQGPMQPYAYRIPLQDFHIQPDGEPVDLAQLVQQQQQQAAEGLSESATSSKASAASAAADNSIGSLEDFLSSDSSSSSSKASEDQQQQQPDALSGLTAAAGGQAADLAVLMPRVAAHTQQLQLQLLQLLQQNHYSIKELQQRLLQQIDQAEAYYAMHFAGSPREQLLTGDKDAAAQGGKPAARPAWLDFDSQRQQVLQLVQELAPLLQYSGSVHDREVGRLVAQLKQLCLQAHTAAVDGDNQQPMLLEVVQSADQTVFAAAFTQLDLAMRQQLLQALPEARIILNMQGADLKAAQGDKTAEGALGGQDGSAAAPAGPADGFEPMGQWPGSVPPVVDVWGYEEVPRKQLGALQLQLKPMQRLLDLVSMAVAADHGSMKSSHTHLTADDVSAVQQAVTVYSGLVRQYDQVLADQAAKLVDSTEAPTLPPQAQRRLMRILRDIDMNALEKLLLWETACKESADRGGDKDTKPRTRRLMKRITAAIKDLNEQGCAAGQPHPFEDYPDLPASVPSHERVNADWALAHLEAMVVGRQFHRGSGDRHFKRIDSYPSFEGYSLEEFDRSSEGELSAITRLATQREDNMMWKEFREKLLRNIGLTAPDLHQHLYNARPPKPREGWSFVVHPVGAEARKFNRWQLELKRRDQYSDTESTYSWYEGVEPGQLGSVQGFNPGQIQQAPAEPYVALPGGRFRGLNEEESVVAGYSRARPRKKWHKR